MECGGKTRQGEQAQAHLGADVEAGLEKGGSEGEGWWEEASSCFQKEGSSCGECGEVSIILKFNCPNRHHPDVSIFL